MKIMFWACIAFLKKYYQYIETIVVTWVITVFEYTILGIVDI